VAIHTGYEGSGTQEGPFTHAKHMVDEARAFGSAISSSATNFSQAVDLRGRVQRHPIGMVLAAAGIGYVLGGGLFSPTTGRLLKLGLRLAIIPFVKNQLSVMAGAAASARSPQAGEGAAGSTF
jgi:hypothetical protein